MTALAVIVRPESPFWKGLLWAGIAIFIACSIVLFMDYFRPNGTRLSLFGVGLGVALAIGFGITFYNGWPDGTLSAGEIRLQKIAMARRWINLSREILIDLPLTNPPFDMPPFDKDLPLSTKKELWEQATQRQMRAFQEGVNAMSIKYSGRIAEARMEMPENGITLLANRDAILLLPAINTYSWQAWADKLAGEGRHILTSFGEEE